MQALLTTVLAATLLSPPSGRPPIGPLERYEPRLYDVKFEVSVMATPQLNVLQERPFELQDAPIVLPLVMMGTYSWIQRESFNARLYLSAHEDRSFYQRSRLEENLPFHQQMVVMPILQYRGKDVRWNFSFRTQVWNSRINDAAAQRLTWPQEWPEEVQDALKPQKFIESDDPMFKRTVERITENRLRMVPPYLAAKELIRTCINEFRVNSDGLHYGRVNQLQGMEMVGAKVAWERVWGSSHDLVCICVAVLRAAGIPARPVVGIMEDEDNGREIFVSWGEFYMPDAGWIPFDPDEMRGKGIRHKNIYDAWPEFGSLDELNERIPISHHFVPPAGVVTPMYPAIWGWDPRPGGSVSAMQVINLDIISRGRGTDDIR